MVVTECLAYSTPNEMKLRVLAGLHLWQVTGLTQSLGESAAKMGEDLQQKVNTLAAFDLEVTEWVQQIRTVNYFAQEPVQCRLPTALECNYLLLVHMLQ